MKVNKIMTLRLLMCLMVIIGFTSCSKSLVQKIHQELLVGMLEVKSSKKQEQGWSCICWGWNIYNGKSTRWCDAWLEQYSTQQHVQSFIWMKLRLFNVLGVFRVVVSSDINWFMKVHHLALGGNRLDIMKQWLITIWDILLCKLPCSWLTGFRQWV
jgi:hypothetical protein